MVQRQTSLSANTVAFCRYLRAKGFNIGPVEERDALSAMEILTPFGAADDLQLCLQTALCRSPQQLKAFPNFYKKYWQELDRAVDSKAKEVEEKKDKPTSSKPQKAPTLQALKNWLYGSRSDETTETATYSTIDVFGKTEYPAFDERELREVFFLVKKLVRKIANRRSRRFQSTHKKGSPDLKKTIRQNILRHGEIIELIYRRKKKENLKVVLLCDVSRSMELYSRFFIQFLFAFQNLFPKVRAFVFSTSLHPVSDELSHRSLDESLRRIIEKVNNWSGGTKIGASLAQFNEKHAHKHLSSKTLTIILSDGWDTGEVGLVSENMRHIHRRSMKVLWLNPLAGSAEWTPEVQGMKAALPFVDVLLPFHGVESLREVVAKMKL
ncbi:MAG TPA: VWA domain-containing protein [Bacteroidetes bacterium]|nr:VWA domain-containing protein [Bacteroidota bacterium]